MKRLFALLLSALIPACQSSDNLATYLLEQGFKQGSLILRAVPVDEVLRRPGLQFQTETYLKLSQDILDFAENKLNMNTGRNYRHYIELDRPWVTQIVMAAHKDRLETYAFEYPIVGSLPYKGFFDESDAVKLEKKLIDQGLDTYRRPVEAYSTAGWLPDPLLSTMFGDQARFVELLFHELTHANFYFSSEADFNEAFASWMGYKAALAFLESSKIEGALKLKEEIQKRHQAQLRFAEVIREILKEGRQRYELVANGKRALESERSAFFAWIRSTLGQTEGLKRMAEWEWNNALILSLGTYYEWVPAIERYAQTHKLSPHEFLAKVRDTGEKIIPEILGPSYQEQKLRAPADS